jgi:hypothetical protein
MATCGGIFVVYDTGETAPHCMACIIAFYVSVAQSDIMTQTPTNRCAIKAGAMHLHSTDVIIMRRGDQICTGNFRVKNKLRVGLQLDRQTPCWLR